MKPVWYIFRFFFWSLEDILIKVKPTTMDSYFEILSTKNAPFKGEFENAVNYFYHCFESASCFLIAALSAPLLFKTQR